MLSEGGSSHQCTESAGFNQKTTNPSGSLNSLLPTVVLKLTWALRSHATWHVRLDHMIGRDIYLELDRHVARYGESDF